MRTVNPMSAPKTDPVKPTGSMASFKVCVWSMRHFLTRPKLSVAKMAMDMKLNNLNKQLFSKQAPITRRLNANVAIPYVNNKSSCCVPLSTKSHKIQPQITVIKRPTNTKVIRDKVLIIVIFEW